MRPSAKRVLRTTAAGLAAAVVLSGCGDAASVTDAPQAVPSTSTPPSTELSTTRSTSGATSRPSTGSDRPATADSGDGARSPVGELEQPPDPPPPSSFAEQLDESEYLDDGATDVEVTAAAQTTCGGLASTVVDAHQDLLDDLGDATRSDVEAVDRAFEESAASGKLIIGLASDLGCGNDEIASLICQSVDRLQAHGEVGIDFISLITGDCA